MIPWDWASGEVKARKYNRTRKRDGYDTAEKIYSGVQGTGRARSDQWSKEKKVRPSDAANGN